MPGPQPALGDGNYIESDDEIDDYRGSKKLVAGKWPPCRAGDTADDERTVAAWLRRRISKGVLPPEAETAELDRLVSLIQEDLVIMRKDAGAAPQTATADYLNVSFPSGWCPACALGKTFVEIHRRVPQDGAFTDKNRPGRAAFLFTKQPTVRFAWTLTPDKSLDRRKCHAQPDHGTAPPFSFHDDVRTLYLRIERQVIAPIDDRLSVFLIRVYVYDVATLEAHERESLRDSILSMTPGVAAYKTLIDEHGDHRRKVTGLLMR